MRVDSLAELQWDIQVHIQAHWLQIFCTIPGSEAGLIVCCQALKNLKLENSTANQPKNASAGMDVYARKDGWTGEKHIASAVYRKPKIKKR